MTELLITALEFKCISQSHYQAKMTNIQFVIESLLVFKEIYPNYSTVILFPFSHGAFWASSTASNRDGWDGWGDWDGWDGRRKRQCPCGPWSPCGPRPFFLLHAPGWRGRGGRTACWLWASVEGCQWQSPRLHQLDRPPAVLRARGVWKDGREVVVFRRIRKSSYCY